MCNVIPWAKRDCHEYASKLRVPALPMPTQGTASPCTAMGMAGKSWIAVALDACPELCRGAQWIVAAAQHDLFKYVLLLCIHVSKLNMWHYEVELHILQCTLPNIGFLNDDVYRYLQRWRQAGLSKETHEFAMDVVRVSASPAQAGQASQADRGMVPGLLTSGQGFELILPSQLG